MRIVIYIIYMHDDADESAYEYVNVYADGYVYKYLCMHGLENEKWFSKMKNKLEIENQYSYSENENWKLYLTNRIKCDIYIYRGRDWKRRIDNEKWNSIYDCRNWIGIGWIHSLWRNPRVYVTLQFFYIFPAIYSAYTGLARKKST